MGRIKILPTDGAAMEYVPFITSTGENNPFRNRCHGLCYVHLAINRTYEAEIFGLRLLKLYLYAFYRHGYEEISNLFRK